jgi:hypothetical protein
MQLLKNLNSKKLRLINLILNTEKASVLNQVEAVFEREINNYIIDRSSVTVVDMNKSSEEPSKSYKVS